MFIIGMVGPFGSGCSTVAKLISEEKGYKFISLSSILKEYFEKENCGRKGTRSELQKYGTELRGRLGADFLAKEALKIINEDLIKNYIIDGIKNPAEVLCLRTIPEFYLFGVFADKEIRWPRTMKKYDGDRRAFDIDDATDGNEKIKYGQRVTETFRLADVVILNNGKIIQRNKHYQELHDKVVEKVDLIEKVLPFLPTSTETYMAMAYSVSLRSSCLKRKVGAIIVDEVGNVFSSGYNEVPRTSKTCAQEYDYCYRDYLKTEFREGLNMYIDNPDTNKEVFNLFQRTFKILDYCRALHAEENAILNVARVGASGAIPNATLYTTTYPCNLCANKIANVGIKNIVYFEPYPMDEAKKILTEEGVVQTPFEGVTYNAYFKLMEG